MKRKLSTLERLIDANICYRVALEGEIDADRLRSAIDRVQRKHPMLRMAIRDVDGEPHYALDPALRVPLRAVEWVSAEHRERECETETYGAFPPDQPQLRVVWLRRAEAADVACDELLVTSTHRVCDGMSMFTIVRELLRWLHSDQEPVPYTPPTVADIVGDLRDGRSGKQRMAARLVNAVFALIPASRRPLVNRELRLEWALDAAASERLKRRCRREGVPLHAAMLVALGEALAVLGKRAPDWIESPIDARRGRLPALKDDMLFFGGGSFKLASKQDPRRDFWERARAAAAEMREKIERDIAEIPGKYQFCEMLRVPPAGKLRSIVRLGDAVSRNGNWNRISLSNLGNVTLDEEAAPLRVRDFTVYVHSFAIRSLGILAYMLHGRLRFIYIGDETCLDRARAEAIGRAFTGLLGDCAGRGEADAPAAARADAGALAHPDDPRQAERILPGALPRS
ncbi:condensation domain-containing protein [Luteimonas aquatica]|uniref:condensation domain-containing protein n=1 Tax=Luteimonas aquatica TaxID=450364 RepID=UPI001F5894E6|nr:condensation domain-containing protein [Luteimonas aquatica]